MKEPPDTNFEAKIRTKNLALETKINIDTVKEVVFCQVCGLPLRYGKCKRDNLKNHHNKIIDKRPRYAGLTKRVCGKYEDY